MLATAFVLVPSAPGMGDPHVRVDREAMADWLIPTGTPGHFQWYWATAWVKDGAGDVGGSYVAVGKGHCTRKKSKNWVSTLCTSDMGIGAPAGGRFSIAPDTSTAELRFKKGGHVHTVHWTARPRPAFYTLEEGCPDGHGAGAGIWRPARATGKILGRRLTKSSFWTEFSIGAAASQCSYVSRTTSSESATLEVRIPR